MRKREIKEGERERECVCDKERGEKGGRNERGEKKERKNDRVGKERERKSVLERGVERE